MSINDNVESVTHFSLDAYDTPTSIPAGRRPLPADSVQKFHVLRLYCQTIRSSLLEIKYINRV